MNRLQLAAVGSALFLSCSMVAGAEFRLTCPPRLAPASIHVEPPAGWTFAMSGNEELNAVGMLHGPPEGMGYLVPAENHDAPAGKGKKRTTQRWRFDPPHSFTTYLYCGYGEGGGPLQLFYPIPTTARECTVTTTGHGYVVESATFMCK
jgi:hypothetical protein